MGLFITFEGGEGTGKTTQVVLLTQRLRETGLDVVAVREPGGTPVGEDVRRWVKGEALAPETELLLFAAARAELVSHVIRPSLAAGNIVIADRYADSTMAYQGYGRGLSLDTVRSVNQAATGGLTPDLTFLLDLPVEEGLQRAGGRQDGTHETKFEREAMAFHRRLRSGFLKLVKLEPERILLVDAAKPPEAIAGAVWTHVQPRLAQQGLR